MEREEETVRGREAKQERGRRLDPLGWCQVPGLPEDQVENPDFETRIEEKEFNGGFSDMACKAQFPGGPRRNHSLVTTSQASLFWGLTVHRPPVLGSLQTRHSPGQFQPQRGPQHLSRGVGLAL